MEFERFKYQLILPSPNVMFLVLVVMLLSDGHRMNVEFSSFSRELGSIECLCSAQLGEKSCGKGLSYQGSKFNFGNGEFALNLK